MIHHRLRTYTEAEALDAHPDEDTVCAFVEGRLEEAASSQMVSHLIACGSCRHTTAQLTRLDPQINAENDSLLQAEGPGRVRLLLEDLASRVIPSSQEDVVFAYQNPSELNTEATEPAPDEPDQIQSSAEPSSHVKETEPD
jgi:anti-sigma factor ChrR (cupin superfamily)